MSMAVAYRSTITAATAAAAACSQARNKTINSANTLKQLLLYQLARDKP